MSKCLELETELVKKKDFVDKETYDKLCKCFTTLEKHCITLEADSQLNQEIFQQENSVLNQNAPSFTQLFELSELKAQSQAKDTVIVKLKEQIKSLKGNVEDKFRTRFGHSSPKNELRKLKGKALDNKETVTHSVDPNMSKDNMEPITPKLLNKRTAHSSYIKHTQEEALVLRDIVEHVKANYPQDPLLESAFRYTKVIQDLLSHISRSCPSINNCGPQVIEVIPRKKDKKVRFAESLTSSENTKPASTSNIVSRDKLFAILRNEAPAFIINFLKMIKYDLRKPSVASEQIMDQSLLIRHCMNIMRRLASLMKHQLAHASPQQNGVVERQNRTLIEAARTMLIYAKAPLFLWAEAVATACYTQNRSMIRRRHGKTPYELLHNKPPDLSYLHVFGALCYPTNDSENLGKLQPKADIGIFIGYAPTKKAFRIYNRRTKRIIETIHVDFDELTAMASEHSSSGPALHEMTPVSISSGLVPNPSPSTPFVPPSRSD
ncbi:retrovirus-related pol polyprotein from transposon TNT 1-94 [Tanacetum coccineum]